MTTTGTRGIHILLADDDDDDRLLFLDVLKELPSRYELTTAKNGEQLMSLLGSLPAPPDILFLDLNMPMKNGFECLDEIRSSDRLNNIPVIIFSTASQASAVNQVYNSGANLYIRKPNDFANLKKVIHYVLSLNPKDILQQPSREEFVLSF